MATTTNYGWTTPDDTALVKDGAAAIRTLGSSVDTTTKALNPSTTLGDIEYRSSTANTNTRLGIGTTGQVLQVSGGVPSWQTPAGGGGMTLLSTTSLTGSTTSITGISGSYKNLYIVMSGLTSSAAGTTDLRFNNNSGSVYFRAVVEFFPANTKTESFTTETLVSTPWNYATAPSDANNITVIDIYNYASSSTYKLFEILGYQLRNSPSEKYLNTNRGVFESNTTIDRIDFIRSSGTFSTGTVLIYGVN